MNIKNLLAPFLFWALAGSTNPTGTLAQVIEVARDLADPEFVSGTFDLPIACPACVGFATYLRSTDAHRHCAPEPGLWGVFVAPINAQGIVLTRYERCIGKSAPMGRDPFTVLANGPEWVITDGVPEIYFTGARGNDPASPEYEVRRVHRGENGLMTTTLRCPGSFHTPMGSLSRTTAPPFIVFSRGVRGDMHRSVHTLDVGADCATDMVNVLPTLLDAVPNPQRRVVDGQRSGGMPDLLMPVFRASPAGQFGRVQIFGYDIDLPGQLWQLTTDNYQKRTVFAWQDPVIQEGFVFFAVEARPRIWQYRQGSCDDGSSGDRGLLFASCHRWDQLGLYTVRSGSVVKVGAITAPGEAAAGGFTTFFSTEPFVFEGRSYLSTELRNAWDDAQIWILGIDFSTGMPFMAHRVDGGMGGLDPEPFVGEDTVHIYFTSPDGLVTLRAATGL